MKILHIITRLIVGGAQENTLLTCQGLAQRGHEVILLTGPSEGPEGSLLQKAQGGGFTIRQTPHLVRSPHPWHDALAYRQIRQLCREWQPEIVHTHSSKAGIIGRFAAWDAQVPGVVHTIHGLAFHPHQSRWLNGAWIFLERLAARRSHRIISVADAMSRQALAAGIGRPDQFSTIYSGMAVEPFLAPGVERLEIRRQWKIPPEALVIGTLARLAPLKGHDDLLAVAEKLFERVPRAHLLWIGDGEYGPRLSEEIRRRQWESRVTLTGLVEPREIPRLLPAMDLLVHPSYREGLARALPQALLAGVPVVSYDADGAGEVCLPGRTGLLVPTGDREKLLEALCWMAEHPGEAQAMGAAGRALCTPLFSAQRMVESIEAAYAMSNAMRTPG